MFGHATGDRAPAAWLALRPTVSLPIHPVRVQHAEQRAENIQNRIADVITRFAGSMVFVYVSAIWFVLWIGLRVELYPYGLLTMIVSLEAIFLSTFVMISQNRADEKRPCRDRARDVRSARRPRRRDRYIAGVHVGGAPG